MQNDAENEAEGPEPGKIDTNDVKDLEEGDTVAVVYVPDDGWFIGSIVSPDSTSAETKFKV